MTIGSPRRAPRSLWMALACGLAIAFAGCTCFVQRIETQTLPDATVGQAYSFEMAHDCSSAGGLTNAEEGEWRMEGDVPPGIRLGTDGRFSGVPTSPGTYVVHIVLSVSDFSGVYRRDARDFELRVNPR